MAPITLHGVERERVFFCIGYRSLTALEVCGGVSRSGSDISHLFGIGTQRALHFDFRRFRWLELCSDDTRRRASAFGPVERYWRDAHPRDRTRRRGTHWTARTSEYSRTTDPPKGSGAAYTYRAGDAPHRRRRTQRDGDGRSATAEPDASILRMIEQGRSWWRVLAEGEIDLPTLAGREGVTASWMVRIVRPAFLAPEPVEMLARGRKSTASS